MFNADLPDEIRETLLQAPDDVDLSASETATVAQKLNEPGTADVVSTIRSLDETKQRRALTLVADAGDDGAALLSNLDSQAADDLLGIDTGEIDAARDSLARGLSTGDLDTDTIEQFAEDVAVLERRDVDGLAEGPIKMVSRAGQPSDVQGAAFEARVAVELIENGNRIDRIGENFILPDDRRVELDIVQSDGDLAEIKSGDFTEASSGDIGELREQIKDNYIGYRDDPSDRITVVFSDPIDQIDPDVIDMLNTLEDKYGNIDYRYVPATG